MVRAWHLLLASGALLAAGAAGAHHSFAGIYDSSRDVALQGTVTEFRFIHPHPFLHFTTRDGQGVRHRWRAEMDNRHELEEIGITAHTFQAGDRIDVSGNPGRIDTGILYLWKLKRPADGLEYEQVGFTPYLRYRGSPSPR